jgi:hypothetical protein
MMKNSRQIFGWLSMTVLLVTLSGAVNAQSDGQFLKPATWGAASLTTEQQGKVASLLLRPGVASIQYIDLGNLANLQEDGWLDLHIPGKGCVARAKAKHVESFPNGDYYWYGSIVKQDTMGTGGCDCFDGAVNFLSEDGRFIGTIDVDEESYEIHDLGNNKKILVKRDFTGIDRECGNTGSGFGPDEEVASDRTEGNCDVKVLALYTPAAKAAVPDIEMVINLAIRQTNQAFRNSQVQADDLTLVLVGKDTVTFIESTDAPTDVNSLVGLPELQQKRNAADADIMVVFAESNYDYGGFTANLTLQSDSAVSLINTTNALNAFTTSHEIAHIFGVSPSRELRSNWPI